jgi:hypothetical protein
MVALTVAGSTSAASAQSEVPDLDAAEARLPLPSAAPTELTPQRTDLVPDGYHAEERVRKDFVIAGSLLFGLPYLGSVLFGMALADYQSGVGGKVSPGLFFLPVIGPYLVLGEIGQVDGTVLLDGIAQTAGMAMLIYGSVWKKTVMVPNTSARVTVLPTGFGKDGAGLVLAGSF